VFKGYAKIADDKNQNNDGFHPGGLGMKYGEFVTLTGGPLR
jgi:hypothetical protein